MLLSKPILPAHTLQSIMGSVVLWEIVSFPLLFARTGEGLEHKKTQMQLFGSMQFLTSKVYLYITTVQSESLACKIGVLHIYNRYTIIYYHNKTKANKKKTREQPFLNTLSFLQFSQHFYKTRRTDSHYYYHHHHHRHF